MGESNKKKLLPHTFALLLAGAVAFTAPFEGETHKAVIPVPGDPPTICSGETHGVYMGMTATHEECLAMMQGRMAEVLKQVLPFLPADTPDTRAIALADFVYNEGIGTFVHSSILRDLRAGHTVQACEDLLKYDYAHGRKLLGLTRRRELERALCLKGT